MKYINPRHKILGHMDRLAAMQEGDLPAPVNVEIDLSNRCSLGCAWCHFAYTHTRGPLAGKVQTPANQERGGDLMNLDLAQRIIEQLQAAFVRSITWTGGGEPTLHPRFDRIITHAYKAGIDQGIYTHGAHIDYHRALLLKRVMKWIYISLDECTPEAYQKSKGVDRFHDVIDGIARLVTAAGKATVGIGFLLHAGNVHQMDDMVELWKATGADYMQFRPTIDYDQNAPNVPAGNSEWIEEAVEKLHKCAVHPNIYSDLERFNMYRDWQRGYDTCHWSALQTVITPDGSVWRCVNKREHSDAKLGNLADESFAEIWSRAGGSCAVDKKCRVMCRGHIGNITLNEVMREQPHRNFI